MNIADVTPEQLQESINSAFGEVAIHASKDGSTVIVSIYTSDESLVYARRCVREMTSIDDAWSLREEKQRDLFVFEYDR